MHQWYNGWSIAAENIMAKVCLVIIDGMSFDDCVSQCGYLEGSVEAGIARRWAMQACLPTISAALYETIHTGLAPHEHGILGNNHLRQSQHKNIFNTAKQAGKVTAVVGHSYFTRFTVAVRSIRFYIVKLTIRMHLYPMHATIQWKAIERQTRAYHQKQIFAHKPGH